MRVRIHFWLVLVLGAIPAHADRDLDFQLFDAAREGNAGRVAALLQAGAAVNARNRLGNTAINLAAQGGHAETVRLLLARGADPNKPNLRNITPLMGAAFLGAAEVASQLLEGGGLVEGEDDTQKTAMVYAMRPATGTPRWWTSCSARECR